MAGTMNHVRQQGAMAEVARGLQQSFDFFPAED